MLKEKIIGKSVWVLEEKNNTYIINKDKTPTVVAVVEPGHTLPDGRTNDDWCDHFVIFDGTAQTDVREYQVVVIPDNTIKDDCTRISKYLSDNGLYADDCSVGSENTVEVEISWGDWKHDHGYLDVLMDYIGYNCDDEQVTEENGSDCYSSIHFFSKVA